MFGSSGLELAWRRHREESPNCEVRNTNEVELRTSHFEFRSLTTARDGNRTRTGVTPHRILSPFRGKMKS